MFPAFEDAFGAYLSPRAEIFPTNDLSPPHQPRFGLKGNKTNMQVSDIWVQLTLDFSQGVPSSGIFPALNRAASEMDKLDRVMREQTKFYSGIVR